MRDRGIDPQAYLWERCACHIGAGSVVEPGAIVCDGSHLGSGCLVRAGSLVKQRDVFTDHVVVEGFPGTQVDVLASPPTPPAWALHPEDLAALGRVNQER